MLFRSYDGGHPNRSHLLMGGTVIPVSAQDGTIATGYIYYAGNPFYFEPRPEPLPVDGEILTEDDLQYFDQTTLETKAFDETVNAYYITNSVDSGRIYLDVTKAVQNNYFSFKVFIPAETGDEAKSRLALRVKPDGTLTADQGSSDGKYAWFAIERDEWVTITVDISNVPSNCTEFSLVMMNGTRLWLRDIAFTMEKPVEDGNDTVTVNGVQLSVGNLQFVDQTTLEAKAFDETVNAYYITNLIDSGRIYLDVVKAAENNYFTFKVFVPAETDGEATSKLALRVKPDGTLTAEQGSADGKYVWFTIARDKWETITVDISNVGTNCTEFSLVMMNGTRLWLRDIAFTMEKTVEDGDDVGEVNGVQLSTENLQNPSKVTLEVKAFDENTTAYYITSQENSSKVYMDTAMAAASTTFTFSACLAEDTETNSFALRVKPDGTSFSSEQGVLSSDGKYIWFNLKKGEWITVTVDISQVGDNCTEFAFTTMAGLKIWVKDISFS